MTRTRQEWMNEVARAEDAAKRFAAAAKAHEEVAKRDRWSTSVCTAGEFREKEAKARACAAQWRQFAFDVR